MTCLCGCGADVREGRRFITGHHLRGEYKPSVPSGDRHPAWRRTVNQDDRGYHSACQILDVKPRPDGYVRINTPLGGRYAHRWRWETEHGPIPAGLEIDHLCYQRDCVNTDHMELVGRKENTRRRRDQRTRSGPILVTGAAGYLGSQFVDEMTAAGHEVIGVDRSDGDLTDEAEVFRIVGEIEPRKVVHFAALVGRQFNEDNLALAIQSNAWMTLLVARACRWIGADLVTCSTSEVYGDHGSDVCNEYTPWALPSGIYALSKRWSEEAARLVGPAHLTVFRPSMPYGPGAPPGRGRRALDNMLWQALHRKEIVVHRGAERSWCWTADVTRGMRMIIERGEPGPYNIGRDDEPVSMLEIAEIACDLTGAPRSLITEVDAPSGQTVVKRLSTDRLRSLGWRPTVDIKEGMVRMLDWVSQFDADGKRIEPPA